MSFKFTVIEGLAPTDSDYEMVYNMAIDNTLSPFWQWAKESGVNDLTFQVLTAVEDSTYRDHMKVFACFEKEQSYNDFVLQYTWNCPKTKLTSDSDGNMIYEKI